MGGRDSSSLAQWDGCTGQGIFEGQKLCGVALFLCILSSGRGEHVEHVKTWNRIVGGPWFECVGNDVSALACERSTFRPVHATSDVRRILGSAFSINQSALDGALQHHTISNDTVALHRLQLDWEPSKMPQSCKDIRTFLVCHASPYPG